MKQFSFFVCCSKCKKEKLFVLFRKRKKSSTGRRSSCRNCDSALSKIYKQTLEGRYVENKSHAKSRNLVFNISLEEFDRLTSQVCYCCGSYKKGTVYVGLDRIDSNKGYTTDNVKPCCWTCNNMKSTHTLDEFYENVKSIYEYLKL